MNTKIYALMIPNSTCKTKKQVILQKVVYSFLVVYSYLIVFQAKEITKKVCNDIIKSI